MARERITTLGGSGDLASRLILLWVCFSFLHHDSIVRWVHLHKADSALCKRQAKPAHFSIFLQWLPETQIFKKKLFKLFHKTWHDFCCCFLSLSEPSHSSHTELTKAGPSHAACRFLLVSLLSSLSSNTSLCHLVRFAYASSSRQGLLRGFPRLSRTLWMTPSPLNSQGPLHTLVALYTRWQSLTFWVPVFLTTQVFFKTLLLYRSWNQFKAPWLAL